MNTTDRLRARVEQIRRAHASAKPKRENTAWCHSHHDLGIALQYIDQLEALKKDGPGEELDAAIDAAIAKEEP